MPSVCFYFQVHQPWRLRPYGVFDIGASSEYFDDQANQALLEKVATRCYRPMNALLEELIERHEGRFRVAFSISGTALDQMERFAPDLIDGFARLAATGCVEMLGGEGSCVRVEGAQPRVLCVLLWGSRQWIRRAATYYSSAS
jgi:alpha-amylase